jgi:AcrR family transcriptional regulator
MTVRPVGRPRGTQRESIIAAAAELISERSFAGTGVHDIAAAVGITGGAIYRHFDSKDDLLQTIILRATEEIVGRVDAIVAETDAMHERLSALVENLVRAVLDYRALCVVLWHELPNLPPKTRKVVERAHERHVAEWKGALAVLRPRLSDDEAGTLVHMVYGSLLAGVENPHALETDRLATLLHRTAMTILLSEDDHADHTTNHRGAK